MTTAKSRSDVGKITYATSEASATEAFHSRFESAVGSVRATFGKRHPMYIGGRPVFSNEHFEDRSPIDRELVLGYFQLGTTQHVREAINAARDAFPAWSGRAWRERVAFMRKLSEVIRDRRWELAALVAFETGKNRLESIGDVEESADFVTYYCDQMEANDGFLRPMAKAGSNEENLSILRPYGVWAVIAPFNFPLALATGPSAAALVTGNTVVFKPATDTPFIGLNLYEMMNEAGLPAGVFNFITGSGNTVGRELTENKDVDGIVFTGSREVGMHLIKTNGSREFPRPVITEMGGKNPALVMASADLEKATEGVVRSAFGAQGQKCSACSRVYVAREVRRLFVEMLVDKTKLITIGDPTERGVWLGPVINKAAVETYESAVERAKRDGGRILTGGRRLTAPPFDRGYFVEATIIDGLPSDHPLFSEELFVPITLIAEVSTLEQALQLANKTAYGLTAGIFSQDQNEIDVFFNRIEAGVVYANRSAGITTGAWPGINPFGGWKASGSTGRGAGGPYYVQQFLREQSRVQVL